MDISITIKNFIKHSSLTRLFCSGFLIYGLITVIFGWLYYITNTITGIDTSKYPFFKSVYFSFVSFLTIGYGDVAPIGCGKLILFFETILSIGYTASFSAVIAYQLLKRPNDVIISKKFYLRKSQKDGHHGQDNYDIIIRIGNKGDQLIDCRGVIEFFKIKNNVRTLTFKFTKEYRVLETTWNFKMRYFEPGPPSFTIYKGQLQEFLFQNTSDPKQIRFSISGTDGHTGQMVATSKTYTISDLTFITKMEDVYLFEGTERTPIEWEKFDNYTTMSAEQITAAKA